MTDKPPRRALGRGLDALLPPRPAPRPTTTAEPDANLPSAPSRLYFECPIERIVPMRGQPRRHFDRERLAELATTIAQYGILEPLVVRRAEGNADRFELVAGERRWRAAQLAGKKEVPVVVKDLDSDETFELALIENLQREDLNAIETASAYARLIDENGYTQEQLSARIGKSRVAITNSLRILKLPESVREMVASGELSEGHGRALLGASDDATMFALARKAVAGKLSVRKLEALVRARSKPAAPAGEGQKSSNVRDLEQRITRRLGARAAVEHKGPGGQIVIAYNTLDDLDRLIELLGA
ncbi:MAG: ParB/RepB/Spo0J family partition protein [Deltaproteobacteria bacterium]|nr:ParB/RepB/Spo0J family partition protein [Deltaproteobacteria bacterium]